MVVFSVDSSSTDIPTVKPRKNKLCGTATNRLLFVQIRKTQRTLAVPQIDAHFDQKFYCDILVVIVLRFMKNIHLL